MAWLNRLSNLFRRRDLTDEIDEELRFHLDSRIRDNIDNGMTAEDARRDALRRFGSPLGVRDETRDAEILVTVDAILQDLKFAFRSLRRRPGFTSVALLTLALGIGVNTAIFTIVESVLMRPLPFSQPDRLQTLAYAPTQGRYWLMPGLSDRDYLAFRDQDRSFEATATFGGEPVTLTGAGDAVRVSTTTVSPDFFKVLGVSPARGRAFLPTDVHRGAEPVVVMSDALWRARFSADVSILNRRITLDGVAHTVIGVLPAGFTYPPNTEVWTPLAVQASQGMSLIRPVIGRLKPGTTREQAHAAFEAFITTRPPAGSRDGWAATVRPLKDVIVGDVETSLIVFAGAVGLVLLIACANVANLLLMRAVSRRHEIAARLALGASRGRLIRLLVTEATLLSLGGGALGLLVASLAEPLLLALVPADKLPRAAEVQMDVWVLLFTAGLVALTTIVIGTIPAIYAAREDLSAVTREASGSSIRQSHRIRHVFVVSEIALALVLLVGAGLLARSFLQLRSVDPGFQPRRVLTMTVDLPQARYSSAPVVHRFHSGVLAALSSDPRVASAGAVNWMPFGTMMMRGDIRVEGHPELPDDYLVVKAVVSPRYFNAMGIRLTGRDLMDADAAGSPGVAIVSETLARRIWPIGSALGKRISIRSDPEPRDWLTIVGVAGDVRQTTLTSPVAPTVYLPFQQVSQAGFLTHMTYVVRATESGDPAAIATAMRSALQTADRDQAPQSLAAMERIVARTIAEPRFQTMLMGGFSVLALLLAGIGIYGVLAASVVERQREIGIRMALGADPAQVVRLILRRTWALTVIGVLLGLLGAAVLTRWLVTLLVDVPPGDPVAFVLAILVVVGAAILAAVVPTRRASCVDPIVALRTL